MRNLSPPFQFDVSTLIGKARRYVNKQVDGVTINLPFVSFSVRPDDIEKKIAREIVIRLADKRVLNAFECCDSCIEKAIASLQVIRSLLVDKQVELSAQSDGALFIILELMLEGIRQFFTFEETLHPTTSGFTEMANNRSERNNLQAYFSALEMLRGHLYHCLTQVSSIADINIPKIPAGMRYEGPWDIEAYKHPRLVPKGKVESINPGNK